MTTSTTSLTMERMSAAGGAIVRGVDFDHIDDEVILPAKKRVIREVLEWYKAKHPVWFSWLEIA